MEIVLNFKLVLLLRLCSLLQVASENDYDQYYDPPNNQESQSQENTSDVDQKLDERSIKPTRNRNNNYSNNQKPPIQQPEQVMPMSQVQPLPMPVQMPMSMQMPQPPVPIPQMSIPVQQIGVPQMPQMSMPSIPMSQMSIPSMQMPQMTMMQMPMPVQSAPFPAPFPGQYMGSSLVYFPMASQFSNFLKEVTPETPTPEVTQPTTTPEVKIVITTTTTETQAATTTTTQATTTTTQMTQPTTQATTEGNNYRKLSNLLLKTQRDQTNLLARVLKNAFSDYSNIIVKSPERPSNADNKFIFTTLRKTQPSWMKKFGIVPIPDNMAHRLMTQMRSIKGRRDMRRRQKRVAIFETQSLMF